MRMVCRYCYRRTVNRTVCTDCAAKRARFLAARSVLDARIKLAKLLASDRTADRDATAKPSKTGST